MRYVQSASRTAFFTCEKYNQSASRVESPSQSEQSTQMASEALGFKNSASLCFENMASASRFLPLELPLHEFFEGLSNKNTLSKTNRDVSLLKEFLRAKEVD